MVCLTDWYEIICCHGIGWLLNTKLLGIVVCCGGGLISNYVTSRWVGLLISVTPWYVGIVDCYEIIWCHDMNLYDIMVCGVCFDWYENFHDVMVCMPGKWHGIVVCEYVADWYRIISCRGRVMLTGWYEIIYCHDMSVGGCLIWVQGVCVSVLGVGVRVGLDLLAIAWFHCVWGGWLL